MPHSSCRRQQPSLLSLVPGQMEGPEEWVLPGQERRQPCFPGPVRESSASRAVWSAIEMSSLGMKVVSFSQHLGQKLAILRPVGFLVLSPGSPGLAVFGLAWG